MLNGCSWWVKFKILGTDQCLNALGKPSNCELNYIKNLEIPKLINRILADKPFYEKEYRYEVE